MPSVCLEIGVIRLWELLAEVWPLEKLSLKDEIFTHICMFDTGSAEMEEIILAEVAGERERADCI